MKKSELTSRQKEIILLLAQMTTCKPVTISKISENLNLSTRTILREMPSIEKWLLEKNFHFTRKPGVGVILEESLEKKQELTNLLHLEKVEQYFSKEERIILVLGELLTSKEPLKSYYLTNKYKISDGTLSNDLDQMQLRLEPFEIQIVRKPGIGVFLSGGEKNYRQAIAQLLYQIMDEQELIHLLSGKITQRSQTQTEISIKNRLLNFIDQKTVEQIEATLYETEKKLDLEYTDSAYIGLVVHLALAVKRIQNNEKILMDEVTLNELRSLPEFKIASGLAKKLSDQFLIEIPEGEVGYITMHLKGAKLRLKKTEAVYNLEEINLFHIASQMTQIVEKTLDIVLIEKRDLIKDIADHLSPALSRLAMDLKIKNPQLKEIKEGYQDVYFATEKACDLLKNITGAKEIPESEIAYLAMHFGAALERNHLFDNQFRAAVVCPTGVGSSRMLAANIKKEYPNIQIHSIISAIHIDIDQLKDDGVDLILSTVQLNIDFPILFVSPLLTVDDRQKIKLSLETMQKTKRRVVRKQSHKHTLGKQDIDFITQMGLEIDFLLNHVKLIELESIQKIEDLTKQASEMFPDLKKHSREIQQALRSREHLGGTHIKEMELSLLHCKTNVMKGCYFGVLRLKKPYVQKDDVIKYALVLYLPEQKQEACSEILSQISSTLLEKEQFLFAVKNLGQEEIQQETENCLCLYYKNKLTQRMERLSDEKPDTKIW